MNYIFDLIKSILILIVVIIMFNDKKENKTMKLLIAVLLLIVITSLFVTGIVYAFDYIHTHASYYVGIFSKVFLICLIIVYAAFIFEEILLL
jgi:RsiW-degrading membrane proteinase PrsW (M82 family)